MIGVSGLTKWLSERFVPLSERDSWDVVEVISFSPPVYETIAFGLPYGLAVAYRDDVEVLRIEHGDDPGKVAVVRHSEVLAAGGIAARRQAFDTWRREP